MGVRGVGVTAAATSEGTQEMLSTPSVGSWAPGLSQVEPRLRGSYDIGVGIERVLWPL